MNSQTKPHAILQARHITKTFPGVVALNKVDLPVFAGRVNAVVGENGAGKSTLMNILSGVYTDYDGELWVDGKPVTLKDTSDARRLGISIIHQELQLVPNMSIAENIFLGREPSNKAGFIDYSLMKKKAEALLTQLEFKADVSQKISSLRVGQQQLVEIAKALSMDVRVLIMDEPTSALSKTETKTLFKLIKTLTSQGVAIIYITHKMDELTELADYVTILRDGCFISHESVKSISVDEIVNKMVGRDTSDFYIKESHEKGPLQLEVENLCLKKTGSGKQPLLQDINFSVHASEVVGIYGLMGAGRTELLEALFGLHPSHTTGVIRVDGHATQLAHPADAVNAGIALIPEDRKQDGLILDMSISHNASLAALTKVLKNGIINQSLERKQADEFRDKLRIKSISSDQSVTKLSGGNQQKVVISKWLLTDPTILLLDEPTRGIDINAKNEIYRLVDSLAAQGLAIVLVSSELPEIMAISDRILTLCGGRLTGEFQHQEFSEERIVKAALPH